MTGFQSKKRMSLDRFAILCEDPMYDEDGVLVDEDFEDPTNFIADIESYDPHDTVNS